MNKTKVTKEEVFKRTVDYVKCETDAKNKRAWTPHPVAPFGYLTLGLHPVYLIILIGAAFKLYAPYPIVCH